MEQFAPKRRTPGLKVGDTMYSLDGSYFPFETVESTLDYMNSDLHHGAVYEGKIKAFKGDDSLSKEEIRHLDYTGLHFLIDPYSIKKTFRRLP